MRREDKKKLIINRRIIVNHLNDLEGVLDYLISKQIFTPAIRERINYESSVPSDRIRHTLDYLITRNALAYQYFLEALILTSNVNIANILDPDFSTSEACRRVIERENFHNLPVRQPVQTTDNGTHQPTLPYPIACTQNHPTFYFANNPNNIQNGTFTPLALHRMLATARHRPPIHPNHLMNLNSPCASSRSNSSTGSSHASQSMSPVINRSRSSSVTAMLNGNNRIANQICSSASATGLLNYNINPGSINLESPSNSLLNLNEHPLDPTSPSTFYADSSPPSTYDLCWADVNQLELDFMVYKTLPNIRKQLMHNECYQMERVPRGLCLLINNEHFYDMNGEEMPDVQRFGTDMDASRLKNLFEKLHFEVEMYVDLKEIQMRSAIESFAKRCESSANELDAICLILLSHGTDGYVYGVDFENKLNLDKDILNIFDEILIGKPKLFIFQACRGEHVNQKEQIQTYLAKSPVCSLTTTVTTTSCTSTSSVQNTAPLIEEESIKRFKQLKISSTTSSGSLQLMYKKKGGGTVSSAQQTSSEQHQSTQNSSTSKVTKTRSRSHSRGKYSSYLVSAASAIRSAIRTSPSSCKALMCQSISTQTSIETKPTDNNVDKKSSDPLTLVPPSTSDYNILNCNQNVTTATTSQSVLMSNYIDGRPIKTSLPSRSDFFIWYSSARGFVSHRDLDGSPFIKCLVTVFSRCAYELELIEMVRKVNMLMQQYEKKHFDEKNAVACYFMVPVAELHLTKRLYFNP